MNIKFGGIFTRELNDTKNVEKNSLQNEDVELYECNNCDFKFLLRNDVSDHTTRREGYFELLSEENRLKEYKFLADKIQSRIKGGIILDVGCGTGVFLDTLGTRWNKFGVEPSSYGAEQAKVKNIRVMKTDFLSANFNPETFDVVTLIDVIEHLKLPKENLEKAFAILKPGGYLVIETGDIGSLTAKLAGSRWTYFNPPEHISFFSKRTISSLLKQIGFINIEVSRVTHGIEYGKDFRLFIKGCTKALVKVFVIRLRNTLKHVVPRVDMFNFLPPFDMNFKIPPFYDHIVVMAPKPTNQQYGVL